MSYNISSVQDYPNLAEALKLGKSYFETIYNISSYLGNSQSALDGAEVLIYLMNNQYKFIQRNLLVDTLNMDTQKVNGALKLLKDKNLVCSSKRALLWTKKYPYKKNMSVEEAFDLCVAFNDLKEIDTDGADYWKVLSLIHCIDTWLSLPIPDCSRRHFAISLCMGKPYECSSKTAKKIQEVLDNLDVKELAFRYETDTFKQIVDEKTAFKKKKSRLLGIYQKAKLLLYRQDWWQKTTPKYIPKEAVEIYEQCCDFFPYNDNEDTYDTFNKRNIYLYECIVNQPCMKDTDFSPYSPFYGLDLQSRLDLLPKTIGTDSEMYNRPFLTQEQWQGVFNASYSSFIRHKYVDRTKDIKYKDAVAFTKWDRRFQKKKYRRA